MFQRDDRPGDVDAGLFARLAARAVFGCFAGVELPLRDAPRRLSVVRARWMDEENEQLAVRRMRPHDEPGRRLNALLRT